MEEILSQRINMPQIKNLVAWASGDRDNLCRLWESVCSADRLTSANALWVITHLPDTDSEWVAGQRDTIADMLLTETDTGKKRMLLQILKKQEYDADDIRTDLLDYCLSKINSECEPYAIRCFSLYTAFKMCRHYPELIAELEEHLEMLESQQLSPGLKSALRQTKSKMRRLK